MSEEKKIRVLFYVTPKFKWKYLVNWLITIWTWCRYSHCELWTPSEAAHNKGDFVNQNRVTRCLEPCDYYGTCYSSTMRGDDNGTRSADASLVLKHPENWIYFEIPVTDEQYSLLTTEMTHDVIYNEGYSRWDLLKFISPIHFPDSKRNICSEAVNNWLVTIGILKGWGIVSPKKLYKKLRKIGYKSESLT